ncbi:MAG: class I tRNA ligase family protein [Oscillospiraceae bacterium]|jgi:methionyl-tRNA synthetase|nr:class I tRNA ligase family protein [Oscillospiraceae bacterium]
MTNEIKEKMNTRPSFPEHAVVTGGMPYGNKDLHFGHVGGMFVHADTFARFLRDRIGGENVIFVSGTDCYGSPITESYRKECEAGTFSGSITDYAKMNHALQVETLNGFLIKPELFAASAFGRASEIHKEISDYFIETLHKNGHLTKTTTLQFYDPERGVFLNGRQVVGRCPISGCQSDKGYADECALGHQYPPSELINPKSALTGKTPEMVEVSNWYVKTDEMHDLLREWSAELKARPSTRPFSAAAIEEFLEPPVIYLKRDYLDELDGLKGELPGFELRDDGKNKASVALVFDRLAEREAACELLSGKGINFRTGKTLVPFRLTGNIEWGVPAPALEGLGNLTVWVWPESLWAPISFVQTFLEVKGEDRDGWKRWWCGKTSGVYQFIGQDNIYFYGPAQTSMFLGMQGEQPSAVPAEDQLLLTNIVANSHLLFLDKKVSSSSEIKPPLARELLDYYTPEQLRAHFLGLGLGIRSVGFNPKPLNPRANENDSDPVLKEGNLLTNVFNRVARSCFYTAQKYCGSAVPSRPLSAEAADMAVEAVLDYERLMSRCEFHQVMNLLDTYIRGINKYWSKYMKEADAADDTEKRLDILADCLHMVRVAAVLTHPVAPSGSEMLADYFNLGCDFFTWENIFRPIADLVPPSHKLKFLEPRVDFFAKHPSQLGE